MIHTKRLSRWKIFYWAILSLLFCLAASAQQTLYLNDNSDWWSSTRNEGGDDPELENLKPQNRSVAESNFRILGLAVDDAFTITKLGEAAKVQRGDAATGREQICYVSPSNDIHLVFERGEVGEGFYLFKGGSAWNGSDLCAKSQKVSEEVSTPSGLRLGMTAQQVKAILGKPSLVTPEKLVYSLEFKRKASVQELNQSCPNTVANRNVCRDKFASVDVSVYIELRFTDSKMTYLGVSRMEIY